MKSELDLRIWFQDIIAQHKGILHKVARTYCRDDEDRQDLVQEILIQVWRSLPKYSDQYKITTWLYRISLNVAISSYRKNAGRTEKSIPLNDQNAQVGELPQQDKEAQLQMLEKFINELNDFDKALMLLYLEDKSHAEIADILGISASNVGTKVGRIKEKLKNRFSIENPD